jgi:hypothetical protein
MDDSLASDSAFHPDYPVHPVNALACKLTPVFFGSSLILNILIIPVGC